MSTKKRFTIAPDLASGIRNTIQSASSNHNHGQLHYDMMAIETIEPDPLNPRKLALSLHEMLHGLKPNDPDYQNKVKELDALNELCESIKKIGIRNAIEVYKEGLKYRIITGERRYWAAILAGHSTVPVRISQKPDEFNLRYTQWVENINRQDLSLWEKFNNLMLIADAYKSSHRTELNERALQDLLGISNVQAYRYFCLLKAEQSIIQLLELGKINNLKVVQELVAMKDQGARNQVISWVLTTKDEVTSLTHYRDVAGKKSLSGKTKVSQAIQLGKIKNIHTAKQLMEIVLADDRLQKYKHGFKAIDWNSSKSISKAFKELCKTMEKAFATKEMRNDH